jgi:Predicted xylanase/chitin deacetylase
MNRGVKVVILIALIVAVVAVPFFYLNHRSLLTMSFSKGNKADIKIPVLMFHHIDTKIPKELYSTVITPDEFNETLKKIKENGFTPISMEEMYNIYQNKKSAVEKPILITFDDGYRSNYEYAYPALKKNKMKANIFIVTSTVGKKPNLFSHFSWDEAKEMEKSGLVEIYNHTNLHKTADESTNEEFLESVLVAQKEIDMNLGKRKVNAFAYPEGRYNEYLVNTLKEDGFKLQFTVSKGKNTLNDEMDKLKRFNVPHFDDGENIIDLIK